MKEDEELRADSNPPFLLHGDLVVTVHDARGLPTMDLNKAPLPAMKMIKQDLNDPFVTGHLGSTKIFQAGIFKTNLSIDIFRLLYSNLSSSPR